MKPPGHWDESESQRNDANSVQIEPSGFSSSLALNWILEGLYEGHRGEYNIFEVLFWVCIKLHYEITDKTHDMKTSLKGFESESEEKKLALCLYYSSRRPLWLLKSHSHTHTHRDVRSLGVISSTGSVLCHEVRLLTTLGPIWVEHKKHSDEPRTVDLHSSGEERR